MEFIEWIMTEKGYTKKAAHDVTSRLKRAQNLCEKEKVSLDDLEANEEFAELSTSVRSQLRNAVRLWESYNEN